MNKISTTLKVQNENIMVESIIVGYRLLNVLGLCLSMGFGYSQMAKKSYSSVLTLL